MFNLLNALTAKQITDLVIKGFGQSLYMTVVATFFAYLIGLPIGILLYTTGKNSLAQNKYVYSSVGFVVNFLRSVPFLLLLVAIIPFTQFIIGTFIGSTATIVPLTVASFPFVARMVESSLKEVDGGKIEAGKSMGLSNSRLIFKIILPECLPSLIVGATIVVTTILSFSAMAGFVGGGGLGDIASKYGFDRGETLLMWICIVLLFVIVQLFQFLGNLVAKKIDKKNN